MKILIGVAIFILGLSAGAAAMKGVEGIRNSATEVWTARDKLTSSSGVVITAGTQLVVVDYMPEGFVALNLGVNVEGEALKNFDRRIEPRLSLRVPQFIYKDGDEE